MSLVLFLKSLVAGYTRRDGTVVAPHSDKRTKQTKPHPGQLALFDDDKKPIPPTPLKGLDPVKATPDLFEEPTSKTDTPAFKKWFGDSKVVDGSGKPLVVYHGTNVDIKEFGGEGRRAVTWVTPDSGLANNFVAGGRRNMGGKAKKGSTVYPLYVSIKKPLDLREFLPNTSMSEAEFLKLAGIEPTDELLSEMASNLLSSGYIGVATSIEDPVAHLVNSSKGKVRIHGFLENPEIIRVLAEHGYDGYRLKESYVTGQRKDKREVTSETFAAFSPNQIKSATSNDGNYSSHGDITKAVLFIKAKK